MRGRRADWLTVVGFTWILATWSSVLPYAAGQYDATYPEPISKIEGALLLHGGGYVDESIRAEFMRLAGGPDQKIVVIPTADPYDPLSPRKLEIWREQGAQNVVSLHAETREQARDPLFSETLDDAKGVWFCGGRQTKLMELYHETDVQRRLEQVIRRGGVVGGTSAGAAIATAVMLVREDLRVGWNLMPGSIVDQHFTARNRQTRLLRALAAHPDRVGLGIDEDTALVVEGRSLRVLGDGHVTVCFAELAGRSSSVLKLKTGEQADLLALSRAAQARTQAPFPPAKAPQPEITNGKLYIVGGGSTGNGILTRFVELAGGPASSVVYIPCSEKDSLPETPAMLESLKAAGAGAVTWFHTKDRRLANDPKFSESLVKATGVWFGGGRQWNFVDSYQNTLTHRRLHELLNRGGVIGGSSAGASIQGDYMPRGDPLGNQVMMAVGYERGLGFLPGVAIDQHFSQRKRHPDMTQLMKRYPQLLGIGIDERTALVVEKSVAEVVGDGRAYFYDYSQPHDSGDTDYIAASPGTRFDLAQRKVLTLAHPD